MRDNKKGKLIQIKCTAIIAAAGNGSRMKEYDNKQFIEVYGKPVLAYSIEAFENSDLVDDIIIVTREEDILYCKNVIVDQYGFNKVSKIITGGNTRLESVFKGLKEIEDNCDLAIIHDGARPLVTSNYIDDLISYCDEYDAICSGVMVKDTIKIVNEHGFITDTPNRNNIWQSQTPQVFDYELILKAYHNAIENGFVGTDDASLVEYLGYKVKMVEGSYQNIKITTDEDIHIIKSYLKYFDY